MSENCKECQQKQQRIDHLEGLVRRMAESADKILKQGEETKEKVKSVAIGQGNSDAGQGEQSLHGQS